MIEVRSPFSGEVVGTLESSSAADARAAVDAASTALNRDRITAWVEEAVATGAELLTGSTDADPLPPLIVTDAPESTKVVCAEVFGPVCVVNAVDSLEEAYEHANATDYGLQAGIFTSSLSTARAAAEALEFGGVTVNEAPTFRADQMP